MRGSIQKREGKRGVRWTAIYDDPLITEKRKQRRATFRTRREAEAHLTKVMHQSQTGSYVEPTKTTVGEYLRHWLTIIEPTVKPSTYDRYSRVCEKVITPSIGGVMLSKLRPQHIQSLYSECLESGLSVTTVALYHGILHRALKQAVKWQMIPVNPSEAVDAPRPRSPEMTTWTASEAGRFLAYVEDDPLAALWRLAVLTGMRRGELLALRWDDVDLERGAVTVRRTITRGKDGVVFVEPKTVAGKRTIDIDVQTINALKAHRRDQSERRLQLGPAWNSTDLVFDRGTGEHLHPNIVSRRFPVLCKHAGVTTIRLHDVRHTAATLMLASGEYPKLVQQRLGHADISMTLGRYGHVIPGQGRDAVDRLSALLESSRDQFVTKLGS